MTSTTENTKKMPHHCTNCGRTFPRKVRACEDCGSHKITLCQTTNATQGEDTTMTTTTELHLVSLTIKETYDKPRKCECCERRRKVNQIEATYSNGAVLTSQTCASCYDALKARVGAPTAAAPNPIIMDGIAGILAGTTTPEQVKADADAILNREIAPLTRVERELAAILEETARDWEYDAEIAALDDTERVGKPAIGPEFGEMLPKIFTDEIRQRVADQHTAGATMPELAAAWGRTLGSIKKIIARLGNGQPANA